MDLELHRMRFWKVWAVLLACVMLIVAGYYIAFSPPTNFPTGSIVNIARGASAPEVAVQLTEAHIIAHPQVLQVLLRLTGGSARVQAGVYLFNTPQNLLTISYRLVTGDYGLPPVKITFPEGETVRDAATRVHEAFPTIPESVFLSAAQAYEGYLFPDTYLFLPSADADTIVTTMRENFDTKTASLKDAVATSGHTLSEIVTLASLIEKEARSSTPRHMIAGILSNRLKLGMPLQVDAVFGYIFNRDTYSPSFDDLKIDSPYNTYKYKGLPPGPIGNPGLDALDAALHPTETKYLYYLTGADGLMHYATTYAGHQANQRRYLKRP